MRMTSDRATAPLRREGPRPERGSPGGACRSTSPSPRPANPRRPERCGSGSATPKDRRARGRSTRACRCGTRHPRARAYARRPCPLHARPSASASPADVDERPERNRPMRPPRARRCRARRRRSAPRRVREEAPACPWTSAEAGATGAAAARGLSPSPPHHTPLAAGVRTLREVFCNASVNRPIFQGDRQRVARRGQTRIHVSPRPRGEGDAENCALCGTDEREVMSEILHRTWVLVALARSSRRRSSDKAAGRATPPSSRIPHQGRDRLAARRPRLRDEPGCRQRRRSGSADQHVRDGVRGGQRLPSTCSSSSTAPAAWTA